MTDLTGESKAPGQIAPMVSSTVRTGSIIGFAGTLGYAPIKKFVHGDHTAQPEPLSVPG
jgi:hypothetical protein